MSQDDDDDDDDDDMLMVDIHKLLSLSSTIFQIIYKYIGQSAGSVGAQIWGETLLSTFKSKSAAVIADSCAGCDNIFFT